MIARAVQALVSVFPECTAREIADALWLAAHAVGQPGPGAGDPARDTDQHAPSTTDSVPGGGGTAEARATVGLTLSRAGGRPASPLRVPATAVGIRAPSAVRRPLPTAQALAPFRRVHRPGRPVIDVDATVTATANARRLTIVTRPDRERGLDVAVVVDDSPVMPIWQDEIAELESLMLRTGAFRHVSHWSLHIGGDDDPDRPLLRDHAGVLHHPRLLTDPAGRRLVLMLTDAVSDHWYRDPVWRLLREWAHTMPTAMVHLLPEDQWGYTAAGRPTAVLRSRRPAAPSTSAQVQAAWWSVEDDVPARDRVALPIIAPRPASLQRWARAVASGSEWVEAIWARPPTTRPASQANAGIGPRDRVRAFRARASAGAQALASVLAGAPLLTLPLIRMLQVQVLRDTETSHLAEVLVSGLFERVPGGAKTRLRFRPGVAELLRAGTTTTREWDTHAALTAYLDRQATPGGQVQALVPDPRGTRWLDADAEPFAAMGREVARRLGIAPGPVRTAPTDPIGPESRVPRAVTIGILTALPVEAAAMNALIHNPQLVRMSGDPMDYRVGWIASTDPDRPHRVALAMMSADGGRNAAVACTDMLRSFPGIGAVIVAGIASGVPAPNDPARHVRLGDVVVADRIVDYGHVRRVGGTDLPRGDTLGVSPQLLQAARLAELDVGRDEEFWSRRLSAMPRQLAARPPAATDSFHIDGVAGRHPDRRSSGHPPDRPKVHHGGIGSADILLRDERERDRLAERTGIRAVEMEASGVAVAAAGRGVDAFVVRGISDYAEAGKSDRRWFAYAAAVAAAYVTAMLGHCPPWPAPATVPDRARLSAVLALAPSRHIDRAWQHVASGRPVPERGRILAELDRIPHAGGDLPALLAFVEELADRVDDELADRLRDWNDDTAAHLALVSQLDARRAFIRQRESSTRSTPAAGASIIIAVTPMASDSFAVKSWIQPYQQEWRPQPIHESRTATPDRLRAAVAEVVVATARFLNEPTQPVALEFLLPSDLLHLDVEWWSTGDDTTITSPLCLQYTVTTRSLDRMASPHIRRAWNLRWQALTDPEGTPRLYWREAARDAPLADWEAGIRDDLTVSTVLLNAPPDNPFGQKQLGIALHAGVPVVLWDRRPRPTARIVDTIRRLVEQSPRDLPSAITRLRREANLAEDSETHLGRHLGMIWDNPELRLDPEGPTHI